MHKITNYVKLIDEIEQVSSVVVDKGQDVLINGTVRDKVSRLLVIHRHMTTHPKPPHKRDPTSKPTPPLMLENLREFKTYLVEKLHETKLSVTEAKEMAIWDAECKRMMSRVNVHVLGLGVTRTSGDELKRIGNGLVSQGKEMMKRRGRGRRLPRVVYFGVKRRVEDLKDSLNYVENKPPKLPIKSEGMDHNNAALLDPIHVSGNEDPFRGIKEPRVRKFTNRLSRRKRIVCKGV